MKNGIKIGLALSGGGYRATAFHLGVLKKLDELKILDRLSVLSTISGGSIIGAYYLLNKGDFGVFHKSICERLKKSVIKRMLLTPRFILPTLVLILTFISFFNFLPAGWAFFLVTLGLVAIAISFHNIFPTSSLISSAYDSLFFEGATLNDLADNPEIVITSANLDTGTLWVFSKRMMGDSSYRYPKGDGKGIEFNQENFPVSSAVAASTAVPYLFSPVKIPKKYFRSPGDLERVFPQLLDGGIYDNQGIHKLTQRNSSFKCDIVICSDASQPFNKKFSNINPMPILKRVLELLMRRIKNLQFVQNIYLRSDGSNERIAYYSLDWEYEKCITGFARNFKGGNLENKLTKKLRLTKNMSGAEIACLIKEEINYRAIVSKGLNAEQMKVLEKIPTSLTALNDEQINILTTHAEILTELQVKLYCPEIV